MSVAWTSADYAQKIGKALDGFERALARRWQRTVADAIAKNRWDFPRAIKRDTTNDGPIWDFSSEAARYHLDAVTGMCQYMMWIWAGQPGPLSAVRCDGWTGGFSNAPPGVPEYIECGVGSILAQVEDWAWGERVAIFERLPLFDGLELAAINDTHDAFVELGGKLGLAADSGSEPDILGPLTNQPPESRKIPRLVASIASEDGPGNERQSWWAEWTGLEADWARAGFFASVAPTINNQAGIAGSLANLYALRAGIIEEGRNNGLHLVESATKALDETGTEVTNYTTGWKMVQGVGMGTSTLVGWHPVGAVVGSGIVLLGFLGETFLAEGLPKEVNTHDWVEVVENLHDEISVLTLGELYELENEYYAQANRLHHLVYGIHSFNLELYDFTANTPTGDPEGTGRGSYANINAVLSIAKGCYELGKQYEDLLPIIARTTTADRHLADKDRSQTRADKRLLELRDLLESFLKTTAGRYLVAGDLVKDAAKRYVEEDEEQRRAFADIMEKWDASYNVGFDPKEYAEETFRPGRPGERDDNADYAIEGEEE